MDSLTASAGNKVTGEIFVQGSNSSVVIKIFGKEKIIVIGADGTKLYDPTKRIFSHYEQLSEIEQQRAVIPFCCKLPYHIPSTFHFFKEDSEGNLIEASIIYKIKAKQMQSNLLISSDCRILTIYRPTSSIHPSSNTITFQHITNCFCFPAGMAAMEIHLLTPYSNLNDTAQFLIASTETPRNARVIEIIGKTIYGLTIEFPGKTYQFDLEMNRAVTSEKKLEFCADIGAKFGNNHCSTETGMIYSCYKVEGIVRFRSGCKIRELRSTLAFHVSPQVVNTPKLSYNVDSIKEFPILNIILKDSSEDSECSPSRKRI